MLPSTDERDFVLISKEACNVLPDFAVEIVDNSMEPLLFENDILLVIAQPMIKHGELGIFMINGERHVKRMCLKDGICHLISINIDYADVVPNKNTKITCQGKVIKILPREECRIAQI